MIRIGDFARLGSVSVRTLRFYDQAGLLPARHVNPTTGYRHYEPTQLQALHRIRAFQDMGFSLAAIQELLRKEFAPQHVQGLLQERREQLKRQLRDDYGRLERIEARLKDLMSGNSGASPSVMVRDTRPAWVASLREKIHRYDEADQMFREVERRVPPEMLTGKRTALWHTCETHGKAIECEVLRYLKAPARLARGFRVYELPPVTIASVLHTGGDHTLPESYKMLSGWMASSDFRLQGAKREIYWIEDGARSNGQSLTEIQFPIARQRSAKRSKGNRAA